MAEKPTPHDKREDHDDTKNVPPPGFRERVQAAQRARTSVIRQSVEIPNPLLKKPEEGADSTDAPKPPVSDSKTS